MSEPVILIICGGKGSRIDSLTCHYQCKSLIPLLDIPAIEFVLRAVRKATPGRIILCIERRSLMKPIQSVINKIGIKNAQLYLDNGRGPIPAMYEVSGHIDSDRMLIMFGHHLVTPTHLTTMIELNPNDAAVSLFATSSESHCKITKLGSNGQCLSAIRHNDLVLLSEGEYYVDLPYMLPCRFFHDSEYSVVKRWFIKGNMPETQIPSEELLYGIKADFPHEFHRLSDLPVVKRFAKKLMSSSDTETSWLS